MDALRALRAATAASAALTLAACGGQSNVGIVPPDAASDDSGASPPESGDAGSLGDAGDVTPPDLRLDPIEVGRAWTYNVKVLGIYPACGNGLGVATTLSKRQKDGKTAFQVQSLCKDAGTFEYAVENDRVFYYHLGAWRLATDEPVVTGHTWTDDTYEYVWEDAGTVTVAAGTFTDCWTARRKHVAFESFTTFCRGVGPVHWHFEDGFGNGYDAILASKNF